MKYNALPDTNGVPLVSDMSSCIMSEVADVNKYSLIYAGAQKNLAPAGVTLVIVKDDMLGGELPICPTMLKYRTQIDANSLYNTPPCWPIYMMMLNLRYLKAHGGVSAIEQVNREKPRCFTTLSTNPTSTTTMWKTEPLAYERAFCFSE